MKIEDCNCHEDIGFGKNCSDEVNCEHCQCQKLNPKIELGMLIQFPSADALLEYVASGRSLPKNNINFGFE